MRPLLGTVALLAVWAAVGAADDRPKDSVAAANTRKKLKQKVTVDYKETRLRDVAADLQRQFDNRLSIKLDNEGGVSNNLTITYDVVPRVQLYATGRNIFNSRFEPVNGFQTPGASFLAGVRVRL